MRGYLTEPPNPGFDHYRRAAQAAEEAAERYIGRVSWTPGQRQASIQACKRAVDLVKEGQRQGAQAVFVPYSPLSPPSERRGWRFLGRVMEWQVEEGLAEADYAAAVSAFLTAARFGRDLSGGDAMDASLGYTVIWSAAEPVWRAFPEMPAEELRRVYSGLVGVLDGMPSLETTLRHERAAMLRAVEAIQEAFLAGDLGPFSDALGYGVEPAVRYLEGLRKAPAAEQVGYFERFATEAEAEARALLEQAALSPHIWEDLPEPRGDRPWKRFAAHYLRAGRFLLRWWAMNQARLRLMALDAALLARFKAGRGLPANLSGLPRWLRTDPYSGRDFVFVPQGADYRLYSYGEDRKDDGGERGPPGEAPDLAVAR